MKGKEIPGKRSRRQTWNNDDEKFDELVLRKEKKIVDLPTLL